MAVQQALNVFTGGLNKDLNPISLENNTLTDALNATTITFNGNELLLLNDMGNTNFTYYPRTWEAIESENEQNTDYIEKVSNIKEKVKLKDGYIPIGIKEHGDIVYIISYNPETQKTEVGSFPGPEYRPYDKIPHAEVGNNININETTLCKIYNLTNNDDYLYPYDLLSNCTMNGIFGYFITNDESRRLYKPTYINTETNLDITSLINIKYTAPNGEWHYKIPKSKTKSSLKNPELTCTIQNIDYDFYISDEEQADYSNYLINKPDDPDGHYISYPNIAKGNIGVYYELEQVDNISIESKLGYNTLNFVDISDSGLNFILGNDVNYCKFTESYIHPDLIANNDYANIKDNSERILKSNLKYIVKLIFTSEKIDFNLSDKIKNIWSEYYYPYEKKPVSSTLTDCNIPIKTVSEIGIYTKEGSTTNWIGYIGIGEITLPITSDLLNIDSDVIIPVLYVKYKVGGSTKWTTQIIETFYGNIKYASNNVTIDFEDTKIFIQDPSLVKVNKVEIDLTYDKTDSVNIKLDREHDETGLEYLSYIDLSGINKQKKLYIEKLVCTADTAATYIPNVTIGNNKASLSMTAFDWKEQSIKIPYVHLTLDLYAANNWSQVITGSTGIQMYLNLIDKYFIGNIELNYKEDYSVDVSFTHIYHHESIMNSGLIAVCLDMSNHSLIVDTSPMSIYDDIMANSQFSPDINLVGDSYYIGIGITDTISKYMIAGQEDLALELTIPTDNSDFYVSLIPSVYRQRRIELTVQQLFYIPQNMEVILTFDWNKIKLDIEKLISGDTINGFIYTNWIGPLVDISTDIISDYLFSDNPNEDGFNNYFIIEDNQIKGVRKPIPYLDFANIFKIDSPIRFYNILYTSTADTLLLVKDIYQNTNNNFKFDITNYKYDKFKHTDNQEALEILNYNQVIEFWQSLNIEESNPTSYAFNTPLNGFYTYYNPGATIHICDYENIFNNDDITVRCVNEDQEWAGDTWSISSDGYGNYSITIPQYNDQYIVYLCIYSADDYDIYHLYPPYIPGETQVTLNKYSTYDDFDYYPENMNSDDYIYEDNIIKTEYGESVWFEERAKDSNYYWETFIPSDLYKKSSGLYNWELLNLWKFIIYYSYNLDDETNITLDYFIKNIWNNWSEKNSKEKYVKDLLKTFVIFTINKSLMTSDKEYKKYVQNEETILKEINRDLYLGAVNGEDIDLTDTIYNCYNYYKDKYQLKHYYANKISFYTYDTLTFDTTTIANDNSTIELYHSEDEDDDVIQKDLFTVSLTEYLTGLSLSKDCLGDQIVWKWKNIDKPQEDVFNWGLFSFELTNESDITTCIPHWKDNNLSKVTRIIIGTNNDFGELTQQDILSNNTDLTEIDGEFYDIKLLDESNTSTADSYYLSYKLEDDGLGINGLGLYQHDGEGIKFNSVIDEGNMYDYLTSRMLVPILFDYYVKKYSNPGESAAYPGRMHNLLLAWNITEEEEDHEYFKLTITKDNETTEITDEDTLCFPNLGILDGEYKINILVEQNKDKLNLSGNVSTEKTYTGLGKDIGESEEGKVYVDYADKSLRLGISEFYIDTNGKGVVRLLTPEDAYTSAKYLTGDKNLPEGEITIYNYDKTNFLIPEKYGQREVNVKISPINTDFDIPLDYLNWERTLYTHLSKDLVLGEISDTFLDFKVLNRTYQNIVSFEYEDHNWPEIPAQTSNTTNYLYTHTFPVLLTNTTDSEYSTGEFLGYNANKSPRYYVGSYYRNSALHFRLIGNNKDVPWARRLSIHVTPNKNADYFPSDLEVKKLHLKATEYKLTVPSWLGVIVMDLSETGYTDIHANTELLELQWRANGEYKTDTTSWNLLSGTSETASNGTPYFKVLMPKQKEVEGGSDYALGFLDGIKILEMGDRIVTSNSLHNLSFDSIYSTGLLGAARKGCVMGLAYSDNEWKNFTPKVQITKVELALPNLEEFEFNSTIKTLEIFDDNNIPSYAYSDSDLKQCIIPLFTNTSEYIIENTNNKQLRSLIPYEYCYDDTRQRVEIGQQVQTIYPNNEIFYTEVSSTGTYNIEPILNSNMTMLAFYVKVLDSYNIFYSNGYAPGVFTDIDDENRDNLGVCAKTSTLYINNRKNQQNYVRIVLLFDKTLTLEFKNNMIIYNPEKCVAYLGNENITSSTKVPYWRVPGITINYPTDKLEYGINYPYLPSPIYEILN